MAERRMFAKTIIDSDAFLDMALSTQALYFHLAMRADDDGFVNNAKKIMRAIGSSSDEFKVLIAKRFIIEFESGIIVIKHWKIHNYIQNDRYKPTVYKDEIAKLITKENKGYSLDTKCIQDVSKVETQVSIGKDSIEKESIDKDIPSFLDGYNAFINFAIEYFENENKKYDQGRLKLEAEEFASYWFNAKKGCKTEWEKKKRSDLKATVRSRFIDRVGKITDYSIKKDETNKNDTYDPKVFINQFVLDNLNKWKTCQEKEWKEELIKEAEGRGLKFYSVYSSDKEYYRKFTDPMLLKNELLKGLDNAG